MNKNIENWYCLFSNIALLNAQEIIKKNNKNGKNIEIKNLEWHLETKDGINVFENSNLYKFIKKNKTRIQKKINKKDKKKVDNEKILQETNEFFKNIILYLKKIRNLYSHSDKEYEDNHNKYTKILKEINIGWTSFIKFNSKVPIFEKMKEKKEREIFFLQLFLHKDEWNDFKEKIESNIKLQEDSFLRKYSFKLKKYKLKPQIYLKIISYIKQFHENKNKKRKFIKISIDLLNYFYKNNNLSIENDNKKQLITINIENKKIILNFRELRKLIIFLYLNKKHTISKNLFIKKEILKNFLLNEEKNFESFQNRYSEKSKINKMHLLKTFNKILRINDENFKNGMNPILFHQILQFLQLKNKKYLDFTRESTKKIIKILKIKNNEKDPDKWNEKIKNFILNEIKDLERFKEIYFKKIKSQIKNNNIWKDKNPKIFTIHKRILEKNNWNIENNIYSPFFDFKKEKNNITKIFLYPILLFFHNKTNNISETKCQNEEFIENLFNDNEKENLIIKIETIKKIFKNKIFKEKSSLFKIDDQEIQIEPKLYYSKYPEINSNLFYEMSKLLKKENEKIINVKRILKKIKEYKEIEKKLISWSLRNEKEEKRNWIMHRNVSKFNSFDEIIKIFKKTEKDENKKYSKKHILKN